MFVAIVGVAAAEEELGVPEVPEGGGVVHTEAAAGGSAPQPRH